MYDYEKTETLTNNNAEIHQKLVARYIRLKLLISQYNELSTNQEKSKCKLNIKLEEIFREIFIQ